MKILIAPNAFKDSLPAREVAAAMKRGALATFPDADITCIPVADGGDGTLDAICEKENRIQVSVSDPLGRTHIASIGILEPGNAIIEIAQASGLALLTQEERNPWLTSSFGSGELIRHSLDSGAKQIIVGLGGSATNDCGAGLLAALGAKFLDSNGRPVQPCGGNLREIQHVDMSDIDNRLTSSSITGLCDVDNPLVGQRGASHIYGPQKGADAAMVSELDFNLEHFGRLLEAAVGKSILNVPGSGAAGGIAAAILALGGTLKPGFATIARLLGLEQAIQDADLVIAGEGKTDSQTGSGKAPAGVIALAKSYSTPVILISGAIVGDIVDAAAFSISRGPESLASALLHAAEALESATARVLKAVAVGMRIAR
ncbi:MAG: glycerate kinase [Spirochaetia bacterium]|nr:glycerate kinase [Spirochaetia bacterium]